MPALLTEGVTAGYGRVPIITDISRDRGDSAR